MLLEERRRHTQCEPPVFKSERRHRLEPGVILLRTYYVGDYALTFRPKLLVSFVHSFYNFYLCTRPAIYADIGKKAAPRKALDSYLSTIFPIQISHDFCKKTTSFLFAFYIWPKFDCFSRDYNNIKPLLYYNAFITANINYLQISHHKVLQIRFNL